MAPSKKKKTKETKSKEAARKSKAGSKLPGSENRGQQQQADVQVDSCAGSQWGPADEAPRIHAFWSVLTEQQRQELLTLNRQQLQQTALELTQAVNSHSLCSLEHATLLSSGKSLVEVLEQGMKRLQACSTAESSWKRWYWPNEHQEFNDAASFREHVEANHIDQELLKFLPEGAAIKAEADAIRRRMVGLRKRVWCYEHALKNSALSEHVSERAREVITMILAALEEQEHFYLYHFFLFPVISAICKALPKSKRATSTASGFSYCDLEKLPYHVLLNIRDWLHAGISMLSRFKSESFGKDWLLPEERKGSAASNTISVSAVDSDKFCISSHDKTQVQLNTSWYKYLKVHAHGDSSRDLDDVLTQEPEYADRCDVDYRLQWVLGVKCDPSSYRGWIQSSIGAWVPTVEYYHLSLLSALRDMKEWQARADESKQLLHEMLVSRQALAEIKIKHDVSPRPNREKNQYPCELPDRVVVALLKREALLVRVRMHTVTIQQIMDKERLRHLQTKQNQGEPKFARWDAALKAEYALQGQSSGRPAPKSHLDAVTDKSGLFERFESLGAILRAYEAEEREVSIQIGYHEEELKQFAGWSENSMKMAISIEEMAAKARPLIEGLEEGAICPCCNTFTCPSLAMGRKVAVQAHEDQAEKLRETAAMLKQAFQTDVRYQLHDEAEDQRFYKLAQKQLKQIEKRQQQGQAVLPLLEHSVIDLACEDPGTVIGPQIILPTLRKRLLARAQSFHQAAIMQDRLERDMQQEAAALLASQELLAEEELEQARAAAKKAKKDRAKAQSAASPEPVQEQPLLQPGSPVLSPSADSLAETENQHKYDELFTSSTTNGDRPLVDKLAAPGTSEFEFGPSSTSSGRTSIGAIDHTGWYQAGRKGAVLPARLSAMTAESVLLEPGLPTESWSLPSESSKLVAESSGLAAEGSGLATDTSISSSCCGSSTQDQSVLHLMMCPLTQAVMIDPVIAADGHTYERTALQKWLQEHQTSPVTGKTLKHVRLVPNIIIRSVIQQQLLCT